MQLKVETTKTAPSNKWLITLTVVFGAFMAALDSTIVNIAIPQMQTSFDVPLNAVQWVVTAYLLTMGVVTPLTSYFANNFGIKRSYLISLGVFTVGSLLCGLAWNLPMLIIFRVIQGLGGAALIPLSLTFAMRAFPPEQRGIAVATFGVPTLLAPVLGPVLGGYLVTYVNWPPIFFINLPIGIAGLLVGWFVLPESRAEKRSRFDLGGFVTIAYGTAALIYALTEATGAGWGDARVLVFLISGSIALLAFVGLELWKIHMKGDLLIDLRLFRYRSFAVGSFTLVIYVFALLGATFLMPVYLQELRGLSALDAGLIMIFQAITSMLFSFIGGWLADKFGGRLVVLAGLTILAVITFLFTRLQLDTPYWWLDVLLAGRGIGLGLTSQPLVAATMAEVRGPRETADGSTMTTVIRNVVGSVAVAVLATIVASSTGSHFQQLTATAPAGLTPQALQPQAVMLAMQDAFMISLGLVLAGIVAAFFLKNSRKAAAPAPVTPAATADAVASTGPIESTRV